MSYPIAKRIKKELLFGESNKKLDYYYWLRDDDRKNKDVLKYLESENDYGQEQMIKRGIFTKKLFLSNRMKKLMIEDYDEIKLPRGKDADISSDISGYKFFIRYKKGKSHPIYMYEINNEEFIYIDPNKDKKKGKMLGIINPIFGDDLKYVAIGYDYNGSENYEMKLYKFPDMCIIPHKLPKILYGDIQIIGDDIYYYGIDDNHRASKIFRYNIISNIQEKIYELTDYPDRYVEFYISNDYKHLLYGWRSYDDNETYCKFLDNSRDDILVYKYKKGVIYQVDIWKDYFIILGNINGCINNRLFYYKIGQEQQKSIKFLIDYDKNNYIENINIIKNGIILEGRIRGRQYIRFLHINDQLEVKKDIEKFFGEDGYNIELVYSNYKDESIIYKYENMITPEIFYKLKFGNNPEEIYKKELNNNEYDKTNYEIKRIWIKSTIPVDIICRKNKNDKKILLYGYGSYGINIECSFDSKIIPLVDEGYNYAIVHVRGSSYLGNNYYKNGKMLKKMNSFIDMNKVAEYFVKKGYEVNLDGRSAGGLLVCASSILRPELYTNVLACVPFVDVITTMSDSTIPLTVGEWKEFGNSNDAKIYDYMMKYSPIDNIIENKTYPNYYITAGLNDPRVAYWEPAKFVATMRHNNKNKNNNLIILKTDMGGGHFVGNDRYKLIDETAEIYSFLL